MKKIIALLILSTAMAAPAATWTFTDAPASTTTPATTVAWRADDAPLNLTGEMGDMGLGWLPADPIAPEDSGFVDLGAGGWVGTAVFCPPGATLRVTVRRYWDWWIFDAGPVVTVNGAPLAPVAVDLSPPVNGVGGAWSTETYIVQAAGLAAIRIAAPPVLPWTAVLDAVEVRVTVPALERVKPTARFSAETAVD